MRTVKRRETLRSVTTPAKRLGRAISARRGELGVSQEELGRRLGGSAISTVRRLEQAGQRDDFSPGRPRTTTLAAIDRVLGWETGSAAACWDDGMTPRIVGGSNSHGTVVVEAVDLDTEVLLSLVGDKTLPEEERRQAVRVALAAFRAALRD